MTVPIRFPLAFALGMCVLQPSLGTAAEPPSRGSSPLSLAASTNQRTANAIAAQLRASGVLRHYDVDIACREGAVELSGTVADPGQREQVVRLVQGVPGVERVVDRLTLAGDIVPVQAGGIPALCNRCHPPIPPHRFRRRALQQPPRRKPRRSSRHRHPLRMRSIRRACRPTPGQPTHPTITTPASPLRWRIRTTPGRISARCIRSRRFHPAGVPCSFSGMTASGGLARPRRSTIGGSCVTINRLSATA